MNQLKDVDRSRPVAIWVMIGVIMLLIQVILGGITRLTGSGLSITEWNVVTGALPPMNQHDWLMEFNKYQQTPQFNLINTHFTLSDFKFIYFWEWLHRLWARLIAIAFAGPFLIFLYQRRIRKDMVRPLILLFLFGALQGAIGWIMVQSGLTGDAVYVKPTRLALHFVFALALIAYAFWVGLKWILPKEGVYKPGLRSLTVSIIILLFVQLIFGALMAGHKAALVAPTWPTINGDMVPPNLFKEQPLLLNFIDNTITIHFIHRGLAYLLFVLIVIWSVFAYRNRRPASIFSKNWMLPLFFVCFQLFLGILSVLKSPAIVPNQWGLFEWLALAHQVIGMLLLLSMIGMLYWLTPKYRTQQL
jgi:cytochrome c oxidase assembly protein subunit 15